MASYVFDETEDVDEEKLEEADAASEEEEGFIQGYKEDDDVAECAECGIAIRTDKRVKRDINSEEYTFCSKDCADEFEEGIKEE